MCNNLTFRLSGDKMRDLEHKGYKWQLPNFMRNGFKVVRTKDSMQTLQYQFCAYTMSFDDMKLFTEDLKNGLIL